MTQPTPPNTDADVELVAQTLWDQCGPPASKPTSVCYDDARAVLDALSSAGRLHPAPSSATEQWAVRVSSVPDGDGVGLPHATRAEAEATIRLREEHRPRYPITYELVRRELRRWPDGSVLVGAWTLAEVTP
ncbi:hypothetical protein [Micromonospora sp. NPDC023956]|uniref:hypothetical protein n=1 Tax=Micromonospora sp. NPDC023956 TaxID=3155722 RepID=UPI0033CCF6A2